jgi:hypothetical protein
MEANHLAAEREHMRQQLAAEREHLKRELSELRHDLKSHSIQTAVAGALLAGAATLFGIGPAAVAAAGAYVTYRILSHRARLRDARVERRDRAAWLTGSCPACGVAVVTPIAGQGEYVEMRCRHGHLLHAVLTLPLQPPR